MKVESDSPASRSRSERKELIITSCILGALFLLWTLFYGVTHGWFKHISN